MLNVIAWLGLATGVFLIGVAAWSGSRFKKQAAWPQVSGVVTHSQVDFTGQRYYPTIRYEYTFQSKRFVGDTVRSGNILYNWSGPAKRMCARYPNGAQVSVYLDAGDPSRSVLEPGGHPGFRPVLLTTAAVMIVVAGLMLASA
jgi:hypothetical protein